MKEYFTKFEAAMLVGTGLMVEMDQQFKIFKKKLDDKSVFIPVGDFQSADKGWEECPLCPYCKKVQTQDGEPCNLCEDYLKESQSLPLE